MHRDNGYTILNKKRIKLFDSNIPSGTFKDLKPGEIYCKNDTIIIGTGLDNIVVKYFVLAVLCVEVLSNRIINYYTNIIITEINKIYIL